MGRVAQDALVPTALPYSLVLENHLSRFILCSLQVLSLFMRQLIAGAHKIMPCFSDDPVPGPPAQNLQYSGPTDNFVLVFEAVL